MLDIVKKHSGSLILSIVFTLIGVTFGFWFDADDQGIYLSVNFPEGNNAFTIGRSQFSAQELDFAILDEPSAHQISAQIAKLSSRHPLGKKLWDMAHKEQGPFLSEQVNITLLFSDQFIDPIGAACKHSPVFGKSFVAFDINETDEIVVGTRGLLGVPVLSPKEFSPECSNSSETNITVWINRDFVEAWIGTTLADRSSISVKAKMVLSTTIAGINATVAGL